MSASFESKKNSRATMITAGFAGLLLLIMFLWSWTIPALVIVPPDDSVLVELNIPDEELPTARISGGGGGGNPVMAPEKAGTASAPPVPGTTEDSRDIDEDPTEKVSPAILKPDNPKPTATKVNENKSIVKTEPKPDPLPPAPQKPKQVMGKTTTGSGRGGNEATSFDRAGGTGTGSGVGNGSGTGGGTGTGFGGGNGSGGGRGTGPRVVNGDRTVVGSYNFQGDLKKATIYAFVLVSPDGTGTFDGFARGSSETSSDYKNAIISYLRTMRFSKSDHESKVTVQFNFNVKG